LTGGVEATGDETEAKTAKEESQAPNPSFVCRLGTRQGRGVEVVGGSSVARRFPDAHVGSRLRFGHDEWDVVGVMNAGQSAMNSEILADLNQVSIEPATPVGTLATTSP